MRTYDPADRICYVHLAQRPAAAAPPARADDECHRLPSGYANAFVRTRLHAVRTTGTRPPLVLLPGGSVPAPTVATPALRLAR